MLAGRGIIVFALLSLVTAARPLKRAALQHGAHFLVVSEIPESLREIADRFQVDLEELRGYNQQIQANAHAPLKPGTVIHLPGCDHSHGWDAGWDGMGWEGADK